MGLTPEERDELRQMRADIRSMLDYFERYRDRLQARAAERERRRQRLNRLTLGLFARR